MRGDHPRILGSSYGVARLWHAAALFEIGHGEGITGRLEDSGWSVAGVQDESVVVLPELPDRVNRHRLEPASLAQHRPRLLRAAVQRDRDIAYLMRALRHICAAQARSADRRRTTPSPPEDLEWISDGRGEPEAAMDAQVAYEAIAELSEPLRATIVAVDVVGLSYKEAARSLRTRVGTIMSRLYRAREQVAAALEAP
jgi:hypothetical protein